VGGRLPTGGSKRDRLTCQMFMRTPETLRLGAWLPAPIGAGEICSSQRLGGRRFAAWRPRSTLVHSMGQAGAEFEARSARARRELRAGGSRARRCGASSYLGRSWRTVAGSRLICAAGPRPGTFYAPSGISVIEFQASIIIGSGSASFEMIRALGGAAFQS